MRLLRVAGPDDVATAVALVMEYGEWALRVAREQYGIDAEAEGERGLSTSVEELLGPRARLYLAVDGERTLGLGGLKPVSNEIAEIKRMYVRLSARGRGVGRALLRRLLEDARTEGFRVVRLESAAFMGEAQSLYRSEGFRDVAPYAGREFEDIPGAEQIQVFMALDLG